MSINFLKAGCLAVATLCLSMAAPKPFFMDDNELTGAGISQLTAKTVDFGATDAPMNGKQDSALSAPAIHIPVTAGAVVLSYNLPEVKGVLLLTPSVLADIFLGILPCGTTARSLPSIRA